MEAAKICCVFNSRKCHFINFSLLSLVERAQQQHPGECDEYNVTIYENLKLNLTTNVHAPNEYGLVERKKTTKNKYGRKTGACS